LPAAGIGNRFDSDNSKQYSKINNKTILEFSLELFLQMNECLNICVAVSKNDDNWKELSISNNKRVNFVAGGSSRLESVKLALEFIKSLEDQSETILIHDAVRPCITLADIKRVTEEMSKDIYDGVVSAIQVVDTLKYSKDSDRLIEKTVSRDNLWRALTPQVFNKEILVRAFKDINNFDGPYTDESSLVETISDKIKIIETNGDNIKITYFEDMKTAKSILLSQGRISA
tara:strand:- start:938 stop:1627 length:690 start_codon:yes stop_codon:yes gene_type:complete